MGSARRRTNSAGGHHLTGTPVHYSGVNIDIGRSLGEFLPGRRDPSSRNPSSGGNWKGGWRRNADAHFSKAHAS